MAIIIGDNQINVLDGTIDADTITGFGGADTLIGREGADVMDGGAGNDIFQISAASHIAAGETYTGGTGFDRFELFGLDAIDLSATIIGADVEQLISFVDVSLTAAQLNGLRSVIANATVTITTGGAVSFNAETVSAGSFALSNAGNSIDLSGALPFSSFTVQGGTGADTITGGQFEDTLNGGGGNDTIDGQGDSDIITGGLGRDTLIGGAGGDTFVVNLQAELAAGEIISGGTGLDSLFLNTTSTITLSNVFIGGDVEALTGPAVARLTAAQLGEFSFVQTAGVVLTTAGTADLTNATLGSSQAIVLSALGNTLILTGSGTPFASGPIVTGMGGNDVVVGGESDDTIRGGAGNDAISGAGGNDDLTGGTGVDALSGGGGNDRFVVNAQSELAAGDSFDGGVGQDRLDVTATTTIDLSAVGPFNSIEVLSASAGVRLTANQLDGFNAVSTFGAITLTTGGAADLSYGVVSTSTFNLHAAGNQLDLEGNDFFNFTVNGGMGHDTVTGGLQADVLNGGAGNDFLNGSAGADTIYGGTGNDTMFGGAGNDIFVVRVQSDIVFGEIYSGDAGLDELYLNTPSVIDLSPAIFSFGVEGLRANGAVRLTAGQLDGFSSIQTAGAVTLTTGGAADLENASVFTSTFNLNAAGNTLNLAGASSTNYTVNGLGGADFVTGGDSSDTLRGGGGADTLNGGAGNDTLTGGSGLDSLNGGAGDDEMVVLSQAEMTAGEVYAGGAGFDTLYFNTASAIDMTLPGATFQIEGLRANGAVTLSAAQLNGLQAVQVNGAITFKTGGAADLGNAIVFASAFNLHATGNSLDLSGVATQGFTINGGASADTISGGEFDDVIRGGGGADVLTGNDGADRFVFTASSGPTDTITDFSGGDDFLGGAGDLDLLQFTGLLSGVFSYIGTSAFSGDGNSQARFAGIDTLEIDTNGDGTSNFAITVTGLSTAGMIFATDFLWT